uniref:Uncharacterized protein n=1 Tax=Rhizophora mucronata TaxID=61149 RepID=A0A2P2N9X7_RHIMU
MLYLGTRDEVTYLMVLVLVLVYFGCLQISILRKLIM